LFGKEIQPGAVCFESLTRSTKSRQAGLFPPDPWDFAVNFVQAMQILEGYGIDTILSTALLDKTNTSFCPVGKDALIVSPDGRVDACYLLEEDWQEKGLDLHLGHLNGQGFEINFEALERARMMNVYAKTLCANCLCRYHCAGACHVNHDTSGLPGHYDEVCIQTRLVTMAGLLKKLDQSQVLEAWLNSRDGLEASVYQETDRLCSLDLML